MNIFEYVFTSIDGAPMRLSTWQGQPLLICNTASHCEYTPQFRKLQRLFEEYRHSGIVVVGLPCNDFGGQEPDDEAEIAQFCRDEFGVTFPMSSKVSIRGHYAHPLFHGIRDAYGDDVTPRWNFHKYLFSRQGDMIQCWPSRVEPDDPALTHQLERNLQSWVF